MLSRNKSGLWRFLQTYYRRISLVASSGVFTFLVSLTPLLSIQKRVLVDFMIQVFNFVKLPLARSSSQTCLSSCNTLFSQWNPCFISCLCSAQDCRNLWLVLLFLSPLYQFWTIWYPEYVSPLVLIWYLKFIEILSSRFIFLCPSNFRRCSRVLYSKALRYSSIY